MAAIKPVSPHTGGTIAQLHSKLFRKLDRDRSGDVSREEMTRSGVLIKLGAARTDDEAKAVFDKADINKDGRLSSLESYGLFAGLMGAKPEVMAMVATMTADEEQNEDVTRLAIKAAREAAEAQDTDDGATTPTADDTRAAAAWARLAEPPAPSQPVNEMLA